MSWREFAVLLGGLSGESRLASYLGTRARLVSDPVEGERVLTAAFGRPRK